MISSLCYRKALRWQQVSRYRVIFQSNYSATCNNPGQNTAGSICPVILGSKLFFIGTSHIPWPASFVTGGHFILLLYAVGPHMSNLLVCFNQLRFQPGQDHVFSFLHPFFPPVNSPFVPSPSALTGASLLCCVMRGPRLVISTGSAITD